MGELGVGPVLGDCAGPLAVQVMTGERFDPPRPDLDQGWGRVVGQLEGPPGQAYRRRGVSAEPRDVPGLREEQPSALHPSCGLDPTDLLAGDGTRPRDRPEVEEVALLHWPRAGSGRLG